MLRVLRPACQLCLRGVSGVRGGATSKREWAVVEKVADRQVPPLSNVTVHASECPVVVVPADPQQFPDADRLLVYLLKDAEEDATRLQLVQASPDTFNIDVQGHPDDQKTLEIHVPVQSSTPKLFPTHFDVEPVSQIQDSFGRVLRSC